MKEISTTVCLLLVLTIPVRMLGCVCADWAFFPNVSEKYIEDSNYVFITGKVLKVDTVRIPNVNPRQRPNVFRQVTIEVSHAYNMKSKKEKIQVRTGFNPGMDCGVNFKVGKEYLVTMSLSKRQRNYYTSSCLPVKLIENAKNDLRLLDFKFEI
jgi:hypothetical protein